MKAQHDEQAINEPDRDNDAKNPKKHFHNWDMIMNMVLST